LEALSRAETEEEIVVNYIKKQTLAEEEHRQKVLGKQKEPDLSAADEEALKQAIEASLREAQGEHMAGEASTTRS
jgi:hypothetical protein